MPQGMAGIVIAAMIAAAAATLVWGAAILARGPRSDGKLLVTCFLLQLPVSAMTFHFVRAPLDRAVHGLLGDGAHYAWGRLLYAPITEEPAKLWPLLVPWIARRVTRSNATRVAAALGLGFGVGEIGLLAELIHTNPRVAGLAWHEFTGFMVERFLMCLVHGLLTAMALLGWKAWRIGLAGGLAIAVALHLAVNLPIAAVHAGWFGSDPTLVSHLMLVWNLAFFIAALVVLLVLDGKR
jgi:hypothetical protein